MAECPIFTILATFFVGRGYDAVMLNAKNAPVLSKLGEDFVSLRRVATSWTFNPERDPSSIVASCEHDLSAQRRRGWQKLQRCNSRIQYFHNPFGSLFHEAVVP